MTFVYKLLSKLFGRNFQATPKAVILDQMLEKRPLPLGMAEFDEWADRIISGTMLQADSDSLKFALATMIMHMKPQEDFCEDAYFIHSLRKSAANQIAHAKMVELKERADKRLKAQEALEAEQNTNVVSIKEGAADEGEILAKK